MQFVAFPESKDVVIAANSPFVNSIKIEASGSYGLYFDGVCHQTHPNETIHFDRKLDWCSNIVNKDQHGPWITYSIKNKAIKTTGFSLRNGCCYYDCCCGDDGKPLLDMYCCCILYSFSFQGSNDNKTWVTIHKVEKDTRYYTCLYKTFTFEKTKPFKYLRLVADEEYPGCPRCLQINEIEIYGETVNDFNEFPENDENEEAVSIIGKVKRDSNY